MGWFDFLKSTKGSEPVQVVEEVPIQVTARIPSARVLYKFRALKDFWSDAFNSQYATNAVYSVRQGNEKLAEAVARWVSQEKVEVL